MQPEKEKELEIVPNFSIAVRCPTYSSRNREIEIETPSQLKDSKL